VVPRVLGLALEDASRQLRQAGFQIQDGGSESHPTAPQGTVIWQDPSPGVSAPAGLRVTLVSSSGPPKIPVPDVAGLDVALAQRDAGAHGGRESRHGRRAAPLGWHPRRARDGRGRRCRQEPAIMTNGREGGGGGGGGIRIAPSVLSADLSRLAEQVRQVVAGG